MHLPGVSQAVVADSAVGDVLPPLAVGQPVVLDPQVQEGEAAAACTQGDQEKRKYWSTTSCSCWFPRRDVNCHC